MTSNLTIGSNGEQKSDDVPHLRAHYQEQWENFGGGGVSEIEEEGFSSQVFDTNNNGVINPLGSIKEEIEISSVFSFDFHGEGAHVIYVVVRKNNEETSMDALIWALNNAVIPFSTVVFLIHVFPETKYIPTPLGKLPIGQVNPEQKENYMVQERGKRRDFLQKFINICCSNQVKVDTILIESDVEAKSILDLIPVLNIRKLVLGTTKSNARKIKSRKGNGVTDQILHNAPEFCDVKIICEGKEMSELVMDSLPSSPSSRATDKNPKFDQEENKNGNDSAACGCFNI
ncbi:hypothetical protein ACJIZ3_006753 [Penstemon smallii]|uniref:Uncharacterized protein n=1 Tax=Penstemon smallii TaxID=265156 RepID=A0ABD3S8S9_9LAMI